MPNRPCVGPKRTVALALNEQVLPAPEEVPCDATDERMDAVVCADPARCLGLV